MIELGNGGVRARREGRHLARTATSSSSRPTTVSTARPTTGDATARSPTFTGLSVWSIVRTSAGWLASAQPCPPRQRRPAVRASRRRCILSTDRGATWAPITNAGNVFALNGRTTLGVAVPGDSVVYAYSSHAERRADARRLPLDRRRPELGREQRQRDEDSDQPGHQAVSMPNMNICHGQCWYNQIDPGRPARRRRATRSGSAATSATARTPTAA